MSNENKKAGKKAANGVPGPAPVPQGGDHNTKFTGVNSKKSTAMQLSGKKKFIAEDPKTR